MKKLILISAFIALFSQSCKHAGHLKATAITFLLDNSDTNRIIPDANSILWLYGYNTQVLCYGAYYRQTYINDFEFNKEIEIFLPNQDVGEKGNLLDDPQYRKKEVLAHRQQIFTAIQQCALHNFNEKPESKVYETICRELRLLKEQNAFRKYLIISSDLCENSPIYKAYADSFLRIIQEDRNKAKEAIKKKFSDACELPKSLEGITVYILFEPKTKEEDVRFSVFSEIYREILEAREATVYIKSISEIKKYNNE